MLNISPIVRLAIGVTLLASTVLLMLDHFGYIPNKAQYDLESRKATAELLAVHATAMVNANQLSELQQSLAMLLNRNESMSSAALRLDNGDLLFTAGDHALHWKPTSDGRSTINHIVVPIFNGDNRWGAIEISYYNQQQSILGWFKSGSVGPLVLLVGIFGFFINWIFLKRALKELDPSAVVPERVSMALDILAEGLAMIDRSGRVVLTNTSLETTLGRSKSALVGVHLSALDWSHLSAEVVDEEDAEATAGVRKPAQNTEAPWDLILSSEIDPEPTQMSVTNAYGESIRFAVNAVAIRSGDGVLKGVVVTFDNVTEVEKKNVRLENVVKQLKISKLEIERKKNELEVLATRDSLTGVLNRRSLFEGMQALTRDAKVSKKPLSCIMTDIDHFKKVNDNYGHATGDEVIILMAQILTDNMDPTALVGRYGGEEFVVVLPDTNEAQATIYAEKLRQLLYACETLPSGQAIRLSASFGVATDYTGLILPGELVDNADKALYKAKESGRNRVVKLSDFDNVRAGDTIEHETHGARKAAEADVANAVLLPMPTGSKITGKSVSHPVTGADADRDIVLADRISQGMERSKRLGTHVAVLSVSIEAMDVISGATGNAEAVKIMKGVTDRINSIIRTSDVVSAPTSTQGVSVSKMGVTELIVVFTDISDTKNITWIGKRVSEAVSAPIDYNGAELNLDARIGISLFPGDGDYTQTLIANSRMALRDAKRADTRNSVVYYDENMNTSSEKLLLLENQLQKALEQDELFLVFQPMVNVATGKLSGFETLVRWNNPQYGLVSPVQFIPIAEQSGLIRSIGLWIFESAARQLKKWRDNGHTDINISVNFSAIQILQSDIFETVLGVVQELQVPPEHITIEITESAIIDDLDTATEKIKAFQQAGFKIALDDFGTGYSSLVYLKRMSIDVVKIDRSFFIDYPSNQRDAAIVSAIITLSHNLGLKVVAEGVETDEQLAAITSMQCDTVQGYVFAAPLSRLQATNLLSNAIEQRKMLRILRTSMQKDVAFNNAIIDGVLNEIDELYRSIDVG